MKGGPYIYIYIHSNKHICIYIGICVESTKASKHIQMHTRRHFPKKMRTLQTFLDLRFKIQDSGGTS